MRLLVVMLSLLLLGGCAGEPCTINLAADHPANPAAPVAPLPPTSSALNSPPAAPSDAPAAADHSGHAAHGAPTTTMPTTKAAAVYACPMHPEVTSPDPNARCPKCGMRLEIPKDKKGGAR